MLKTSEWVSIGHPDKVADAISCYLLDRYLEIDKNTRFALEVQIKDDFVTLGGEITSMACFNEQMISDFVKEAVNAIGYTRSYQNRWGADNTICGDDLVVTQHVGMQSPDIAQGVDSSGWGDQGIFWGMAVNSPETEYMPRDWYLARKIGKHLYDIKYAGIDIKTQVTLDDDGIEEVVVAIPMLEKHNTSDVVNCVKFCCGKSVPKEIFVNGTGRFVKHGPIGDCGTTGRKLAVDFYGGNCRIGGGSTWTKDWTKADLTLNVMARRLALDFIAIHEGLQEVHCAISCRIGSPEIRIAYFDGHMNELDQKSAFAYPVEVADQYYLREPRFFGYCMNGLLS